MINESLITHRASFSFDSLEPESKPVSNSSNPVSASSSKTSSDFSIHHNFTIANRDPKSNPNLAQDVTDQDGISSWFVDLYVSLNLVQILITTSKSRLRRFFLNIHSAQQNLTSLELKSSVVSNPVCQSELFISRFLLEKKFLSKISKI